MIFDTFVFTDTTNASKLYCNKWYLSEKFRIKLTKTYFYKYNTNFKKNTKINTLRNYTLS